MNRKKIFLIGSVYILGLLLVTQPMSIAMASDGKACGGNTLFI
jgi:hypothetical protein